MSYGSPPLLWHPLGCVSSQTGVQQGDPLGPMLFALVLHKLVSSIDADDGCLNLILQTWYLDDGVLANNHTAVLHALQIIEEMGPDLGLSINRAKYELFSPFLGSRLCKEVSRRWLTLTSMKRSHCFKFREVSAS